MSKLILTTKGTNALKNASIGYIIIEIIGIFTMWWFAFMFLEGATDSYDSTWDTYAIIFSIIAIVATIIGGWSARKHFYSLFSFLSIYEDYIEGAGMQGNKFEAFKLKYKNIVCVSVNGLNITLNTTIGTFVILSNLETATKVYEHFNSNDEN